MYNQSTSLGNDTHKSLGEGLRNAYYIKFDIDRDQLVGDITIPVGKENNCH